MDPCNLKNLIHIFETFDTLDWPLEDLEWVHLVIAKLQELRKCEAMLQKGLGSMIEIMWELYNASMK